MLAFGVAMKEPKQPNSAHVLIDLFFVSKGRKKKKKKKQKMRDYPRPVS